MTRERLLAALLLAVLLIAAYLSARPPVPTAATRASNDDAFGGYAAWYELEQREGIDVARFRSHHDALAADGTETLIVAFPQPGVATLWNPSEAKALAAWVAGGGHLVVAGSLAPVGVSLRDTSRAGGPLQGPWSAYVTHLAPSLARLMLPARLHARVLLADRGGPLAARYTRGRGTVLALADPALLENRALARDDDARFAFLAAQPAHQGGRVAFDEAIRGDIVERPWYRALDDPEKLALALAAFAGLLWLLDGLLRLGPPVRVTPPREPTSAEFVAAVAALYAQAGARAHARDVLLTDARRAVERAPRTPENLLLAARVARASEEPVRDDAALYAAARLAHTVREETRRERTVDPDRATPARGARSRRRRR